MGLGLGVSTVVHPDLGCSRPRGSVWAMGYFDHLAIAVDFSEPSQIALEACRALVGLVHCERVTVLHAVKHVVLPLGDTPKVKARLEALRERIHDAAQTQLEALCADIKWPQEVQVEHRIVVGSPARVIPDTAKDMGASVLLVGTHSRRGIKRWLKGSVAERMVEGAKLPVLVLPIGDDGVPPDAELAHLEQILVAVDVHAEADKVVRGALEAAVSFAGQKVDLTLLTVAGSSSFASLADDDELMEEFLDALQKDADRQLVDLEARHDGDVDHVHHLTRKGDPDEEILKEAQRLQARMIVVGSHGQDGAPFLQLGSTTANVVRSADVSVLVVPCHPEHEN